jgi:hypothetical protein
VRFQITSETCQYYKVDYWGQLPATYKPQPENAARYIEARARNVRESFRRLPTAPISQLAAAFPGVDPDAFGRGLSPEHVSSVSVSGVGRTTSGSASPGLETTLACAMSGSCLATPSRSLSSVAWL